MGFRRQLSLFLPEPERSVVDAVRSRFDPKQHALIPAHVTLCRETDVEDWEALWGRVRALGPWRLECRLEPPEHLEDGCVLIPMPAAAGAFDELRARLLGPARAPSRPHITLLHPRNAEARDGRFEAIRSEPLPLTVSLCEISLIEQADGGRWQVLARHA